MTQEINDPDVVIDINQRSATRLEIVHVSIQFRGITPNECGRTQVRGVVKKLRPVITSTENPNGMVQHRE